MDDMLIHTKKDVQLHRKLVHRVLDKLRRHDLFLKPDKCLFEQSTMEFLGVVLENGTIRMDPTKIRGVADWPLPQTVKDVRAFLGFTGFYRYFVPNYSMIARPLIELTKKAVPFHWETPQRKAFETLKTLMCRRPILRQPDYKKPFLLATDASAYSVGAVLSQEGELHPRTKKPIQHPVAYYSATFTPTERNYDIYERELLAILKALEHWRPHLAATEIPVTVLTDHANLTFWKNPQKVNRRVARWFAMLQDYNLLIKHVPGKLHVAPDMLSRPPGTDKGELDNQDVTLLPPDSFIRLTLEEDQEIIDLERNIVAAQKKHPKLLEHWRRTKQVSDQPASYTHELTACKNNLQAAIPPEDSLKREIIRIYHDSIAAGHPGRDQTYENVARWYWWPGMRDWIAQYVKGCGPCQQNKTLTHQTKVPLYRINVPSEAQPFQVIAMDLITQLPKCDGFDAILTIVDHGCSHAAVFIPCHTTITGEGVAKLYFEHIYKWFGLPDRMISDRDPHFTSHFAKALCTQLGIKQNISTAFHPQTDGPSERKNQWVEQFLRFLTMHQQDDWAQWLPIATAVHNNAVHASTKVVPMEALLGYLPRLDY
jgi:RNase H-like domain found in reverse transcriptase/Integrase zinc binding domain